MNVKLALVTGASAGIGAALAEVFASHGYDLALTARRADRLAAQADKLKLRHGCEVMVLPADLADPAAPAALIERITERGRSVDALVNNAGLGLAGPYAASGWRAQADFIQVMTTAPCELVRLVLPGMIERRYGRILNVASVAGLIPGAANGGLYGPSKAFLARFSQSLHLETRGQGVHVSALCPGFTYSEFHDVSGTRADMAARIPAWLWMGADEVAEAGYEAVEANRPLCVPGAPYKAIVALGKLLPDEWLMALMAGGAGGGGRSAG